MAQDLVNLAPGADVDLYLTWTHGQLHSDLPVCQQWLDKPKEQSALNHRGPKPAAPNSETSVSQNRGASNGFNDLREVAGEPLLREQSTLWSSVSGFSKELRA